MTADKHNEILNRFFPGYAKAGQLMRYIVSPFLLILIVRYVIPTDLFSTALWFDSQGWNLVWTDQVSAGPVVLLDNLVPGSASVEGLVFSAVLMLGQLLITGMMIQSGGWLTGTDRGNFMSVMRDIFTRKVKIEQLNMQKFTFLFAWLGFVAFDAYTSVVYRTATTSQVDIVTVLTHSLFMENIFSEIFLGETLLSTAVACVLLWEAFQSRRGMKHGGVRRTASSQQASAPPPRNSVGGGSNPPPPRGRATGGSNPPPPPQNNMSADSGMRRV